MTSTYDYEASIARYFAKRADIERRRIEVEARILLKLVSVLRIPVSDEARDRVMASNDLMQLHRWADRVVAETFTSMDDLFAREVEEGPARVFLISMKLMGITVTDEAAARISSCTDVQQVERWANRINKILSADELFD